MATGDRIGSNQSSNGDTRGLECEKYVPYGMTTYMPQHTTGNVSKTKSTASPTVNNVDCKKNAAYEGATEGVKQKGIMQRFAKKKAARMPVNDVECKKNEAYGGVAAGYKVIREVTLEKSESSSIRVSPNKA